MNKQLYKLLATISAVIAGVFLATWIIDWLVYADLVASTSSGLQQYEFWKVFFWITKTALIVLWLSLSIKEAEKD